MLRYKRYTSSPKDQPNNTDGRQLDAHDEFPMLVIKMGCFDEHMALSKLTKRPAAVLLQRLLLHESLN